MPHVERATKQWPEPAARRLVRMSESNSHVRLRAMESVDVPAVLDVQQPGAVVGLAEVFPQDEYPFPRDLIAKRWLEELVSTDIDCFVVLDSARTVGFAAVRDDELLHFGIALELWGKGTAQAAHAAVVDLLAERGIRRAWLWVFTKNRRGRRFYERLGWRQTGERSHSTFPPHAQLLRYERDLTDPPT